MNSILVFIISFITFYLLYLFFVILNKKKKNKIFDTKQASILINLNKLDINNVDKNVFTQVLSISNSFILALTFTFAISEFFKSFILSLLVSFIIMIVLIIVVYKLVGLFFKREGR